MKNIIKSGIVVRQYSTIINKQKIKFKWIRNRNLTPLLDIKVKHGSGETTLWNILFNKSHCGDFGLRKDGYLRRDYHDEWLEIREKDWELIQKHANDKFNFRYLDWEKKKEVSKGDVCLAGSYLWCRAKSPSLIVSQRYRKVGTGILTDRLKMERQVSDQAVNGREYIFRLIYKGNDLYQALEEDENITCYFNTQAQLEADREEKALCGKLIDYQKEILAVWEKDKKSTLILPKTLMSEVEKEELKKFLEHYTKLMKQEIKGFKDLTKLEEKELKNIIKDSTSSQEKKEEHSKKREECSKEYSKKIEEYETKIEKVELYTLNKLS